VAVSVRDKPEPRQASPDTAALPKTPGESPAAAVHLVSLSAVTWDFALVGRTRMLTEAWRHLNIPTTFVQVPSLRTAAQRLRRFGRGNGPHGVVRPWPACPQALWAWLGPERLAAICARRARGLRQQLDRRLAWERAVAVVVSPVWAPWLDQLPFGAVLYDCIDELSVHVPRPELAGLYSRWEEQLIRRADGAVTTASRLAQTLQRRRPNLPQALIRNGVDAERFAELARRPPPADLPATSRPRVGFVGAMYEWLDWELMAHAVAGLTGFEFVFIGPHRHPAGLAALAKYPNVRLLGRRPYEQVPAYVQAFDVGWVPFREGDVAAAANPVKIYEYLALGKPVVSTPVADLDAFGPLVTVARGAAEMIPALRRAVDQPGDPAARVAFARANSWQVRARALADFAAGRLGSRATRTAVVFQRHGASRCEPRGLG
jgi:glycosyltransferase involved in cell wall biosynthesis